MSKLENFLLLIGVFGLIVTAGGIIYNLFEESVEND